MAYQPKLDTPRDFVQSGWDQMRELGLQFRSYTFQQLDGFNYVQPTPISFEVPIDLQVEYGTFAKPTAPSRPVLNEIAVTLPVAPELADIEVPEVSDAPDEPSFSLVYAKPTAPNAPMPTRPETPPVTLVPIEIPDAPSLPDIEDPTLYTITLPPVPDLVVPEFEGVRPVLDFEAPTRTFSWAPNEYDDSQIQVIRSRLSSMAIDGLGLPPDVETAIFDRARGREDALTLQATQDFEDTLGTRGLRQPAGLLLRGRRRIATEARMRSSAASRDLGIEVVRQNVEAVRWALTQAISLEVSLIQANTANNELTLRGAQAEQQFAIDLFNTRVALHNAQWEGFKADAQVFESRIRALTEEIGLYKAQIDAQKVIGDINETLVRGLAERLRARSVLVELYRANVEAARAKGEYNTQLLEQDRLKLQIFSTDVEAYGKQWDGYRINVEAEIGNIRAQEAMGNVFGRRVEAWATKNRGYFDQGRFRIEAQVQQLEKYKASLQGALIDSQTQTASLEGKLRTYGTDATVFGVQAQASAIEGQFYDNQAQLRMKGAELRIGTAHKSAELTANYALKVIDQQIEILKAKAGVVSQLASATMSGVNFGASYSGSIGISGSYGTSWSYSGDTDDQNPPFFVAPGF